MAHRLCGRARTRIWMSGHYVMIRLVQTEPFDGTNLFAVEGFWIASCMRSITRSTVLLPTLSVLLYSPRPLCYPRSIIEKLAHHASTRFPPSILQYISTFFRTLEEPYYNSNRSSPNIVARGEERLGFIVLWPRSRRALVGV